MDSFLDHLNDPQFMISVAIPGGGLLLAFFCMLFLFRAGRRQRLIKYLPTCKTTGVFMGLVELKGTAESVQPLMTYLTERLCVYYTWSITEQWSRTRTETYTDSNGKIQTRTVTESGWTTIADGKEYAPFYLRDDCGAVLIQPKGAEVEPIKTMDVYCGTGDPLYYGKGPRGAVSNSDHRRHFSEEAIPLHVPLYVVGQARERQDVIAPEIAKDPHAEMFLISTRSEEKVNTGLRLTFWILAVLGCIFCVAGFVAKTAMLERRPADELTLYILVGGGYLVAWGLCWLWMAYNSLVQLRQRVAQAWSNVDVQLKRRHDLIPNLLAAVKSFRDYERQLQVELAHLRSQMDATAPGLSGPDPQACTGQLAAIIERYPQLKASESFMSLQQSLVDTEDRISLARGYFNSIAAFYNTCLEIIPDRYVAALSRMKPRPLMTADSFERKAIEVKFAD